MLPAEPATGSRRWRADASEPLTGDRGCRQTPSTIDACSWKFLNLFSSIPKRDDERHVHPSQSTST